MGYAYYDLLVLCALVLCALVLCALVLCLHNKAHTARGGQLSHTLNWPSPTKFHPAAVAAGRRLAKDAVRRGNYGWPSPGAFDKLNLSTNFRRVAESVYLTEVGLACLRPYRGAPVGHRLNLNANANANAKITPADVLAAARKAGCAPLATLRAFATAVGASRHAVAAAGRGETDALGPAFARDPAGWAAVFAADLSSRENQLRGRVASAAFEDALAAWAAAHLPLGVSFAREGDMHSAETVSAERASAETLTPDILFSEPVMLGGQLVRWLDAKNYCYYGSPLTIRSLVAQAAKYELAFGPGAFVFRYGVDPAAPALKAALLDGNGLQHLPLAATVMGTNL